MDGNGHCQSIYVIIIRFFLTKKLWRRISISPMLVWTWTFNGILQTPSNPSQSNLCNLLRRVQHWHVVSSNQKSETGLPVISWSCSISLPTFTTTSHPLPSVSGRYSSASKALLHTSVWKYARLIWRITASRVGGRFSIVLVETRDRPHPTCWLELSWLLGAYSLQTKYSALASTSSPGKSSKGEHG